MNLVLKGPMVSGKNQIQITMMRGRIHKYPNPRFEMWRNRMSKQIYEQKGTLGIVFKEPVRLTASYFPGDRIRRDATGILDALFHLLEFTQIVEDDVLIKFINWVEGPIDKLMPRIEMGINPWRE